MTDERIVGLSPRAAPRRVLRHASPSLALAAALVMLSLSVSSGGCRAHTSLEPVGDGHTVYGVSFGGPMVESFGTYLPIPNVTAAVQHGVRDDLDVTGSLYLTPLMFGLVGVDVGAAWYPVVDSAGTTLSVQPRLLMLASVKSGVDDRVRIYPAVSASAAWRNGADRVYTGFDLTVPVSKPDFDPEPAPVVLSPFVGYRFALGERSALHTEIKWMGINVRTNATADFINPFGLGGLAPFIAYEFGL